MKHIGVIGASGMMGHGIARNLLAKGFTLSLTVHRNRERVADLLAAGAKQAFGPAELGTCDAVVICVTGSPQVEETLLSPNGVLSKARAGLVVIDTSTSEPESTRRLAALCAQHGATLVDAPLARTPVEAELGKLNTMVGAEQAVFDKIRPVLAAYCENIFHVGGPSAGHVVKLLNNFVAQAICTATAEAFAVGALAGIEPQKLVDVVSAGAVNSGLFQAMAKTLGGDFAGLKLPASSSSSTTRARTCATTPTWPNS